MSRQLVIITSLVTAILIGPITVMKLMVPSGPWRLLPLVIFVVALEGGLTTWWLGKKKRRINHLYYRLSEMILLLVALRISTWIVAGNLPNLETIRSFILFPSRVVDVTFVVIVLLALFAWERSITFSSTFDKLILSSEEVAYYTLPTVERLQSGITGVVPKNRIQLQQEYIRQWVVGGIILVFFAVLTTFDLPEPSIVTGTGFNLRNIGRLGLRSDILLAMIFYFLVGFWLASLGRMHILQARWLTTGLPADTEILQHWRTRGLLLLVLLGIIAAFLPIGSSFAFSRIIVAILSVVAIAFGLFLSLILYLIYLISSLFGNAVPNSPPPPVDLSQLSQEIDQTGSSSNIINIILGSIFWVAIISIVIIALYFFLRDRGVIVGRAQFTRPWRAFIAWLKKLWKRANSHSISLPFRWENPLKFSKQISEDRILPWRFFPINALSPRDRIFYFYLSIVKRAGKKGISRAPSMTPSEYATDLESAWPEASSDIHHLTEEFQEARYSPDPIDKDKLSIIQETFKRIRSTLRRRKVE